ncbi:hypothetical protein C8R47DRAFT_158056 [Mycena vitilis]|nr:hypothetical protein C8R47DRAFT_158056 [Mycena vitilis]
MTGRRHRHRCNNVLKGVDLRCLELLVAVLESVFGWGRYAGNVPAAGKGWGHLYRLIVFLRLRLVFYWCLLSLGLNHRLLLGLGLGNRTERGRGTALPAWGWRRRLLLSLIRAVRLLLALPQQHRCGGRLGHSPRRGWNRTAMIRSRSRRWRRSWLFLFLLFLLLKAMDRRRRRDRAAVLGARGRRGRRLLFLLQLIRTLRLLLALLQRRRRGNRARRGWNGARRVLLLLLGLLHPACIISSPRIGIGIFPGILSDQRAVRDSLRGI